MLTFEEIANQCYVNMTTLNSGCVECNKKAVEFYESVEKMSIVLDILLSKKVDIFVLSQSDNVETYNDMMSNDRYLTFGQFKGIKEIINNVSSKSNS